METPDTQPPNTQHVSPRHPLDIRPGDNFGGSKVIAILCSSEDYVIFLHVAGVGHRIDADLKRRSAAAIALFDTLYARAIRSVPIEEHRVIMDQLASALAVTLDEAKAAPETPILLHAFAESERHIEDYARKRAGYSYVYAAFILYLLLCGVGYLLLYVFPVTGLRRIFFGGALFGSTGALLSVCIRSRTLNLDTHYYSARAVALQGALRIILGALSGLVGVTAIHAELLLGSFKENPTAIFVACFAFGFVEKAIPDFLGSITSDNSKQSSR